MDTDVVVHLILALGRLRQAFAMETLGRTEQTRNTRHRILSVVESNLDISGL
jgi:hypothetical protein